MQRLRRYFGFNLLVLVLSASLFPAAFAATPEAISDEDSCHILQVLPGSTHAASLHWCAAGGSLHCTVAPTCNLSSNGFSALPGITVEAARLIVKVGHHPHKASLYSFYATRLLRPPIA